MEARLLWSLRRRPTRDHLKKLAHLASFICYHCHFGRGSTLTWTDVHVFGCVVCNEGGKVVLMVEEDEESQGGRPARPTQKVSAGQSASRSTSCERYISGCNGIAQEENSGWCGGFLDGRQRAMNNHSTPTRHDLEISLPPETPEMRGNRGGSAASPRDEYLCDRMWAAAASPSVPLSTSPVIHMSMPTDTIASTIASTPGYKDAVRSLGRERRKTRLAQLPAVPIESVSSPASMERERVLKWITYYWSTGQSDRAFALGWDGEWERRGGGLVPSLRKPQDAAHAADDPAHTSSPPSSSCSWSGIAQGYVLGADDETPTSTALQHSAWCSRDHSAPTPTLTTSPKTPVQHGRAVDFVPGVSGSGVLRESRISVNAPLDTSPRTAQTRSTLAEYIAFGPGGSNTIRRPPADDARGRESYGNVSKLQLRLAVASAIVAALLLVAVIVIVVYSQLQAQAQQAGAT